MVRNAKVAPKKKAPAKAVSKKREEWLILEVYGEEYSLYYNKIFSSEEEALGELKTSLYSGDDSKVFKVVQLPKEIRVVEYQAIIKTIKE